MDARDNGGPAFPTSEVLASDGSHERWAEDGMTLRDYFAAKAMQALITSNGLRIEEHTAEGILIRPAREAIPPIAYDYADNMLKARQA